MRLSCKHTLALSAVALSLVISTSFDTAGAQITDGALTHDRDGVTDAEITIGSCCPLTGPASQLGIQQLCGAKSYLNYVNEHGGVHGRQIKVLEFDDCYDPEKAIVVFHKFLADKCFAGGFFVGTPTAAKYTAMAETNGVPIVGLFTGAQILHSPFKHHIFSVRASYDDETREQVNTLYKDTGSAKIGVIYQDDAFGAAVLGGYKKALQNYHAEPQIVGSFERNTVNVAPAVKELKDSHAAVVGMAGQYTSLAALARKAHQDNWYPQLATVSFIGTESYIKAAGKDAEGTVISQVMPSYHRDDLPNIVLYRKLMKKYFPAQPLSYTSLEGFVDAIVIVEGLKDTGKDLTRSGFVHALESIRDRDIGLGPDFKLTYGPGRHKAFDKVIMTVVKNGQANAFSNWKTLSHG